MAELEYRSMAGDEADLQRFAACFASNDDPKDLRHLRWQYLANPVERVYADFAVDPGRFGIRALVIERSIPHPYLVPVFLD